MLLGADILAGTSLGFVLGLRHAFDSDHVVAVWTIVSEHKSVRRSSLVGALWGLGHTTSLLAVGVAVIALKLSIPGRMALWMEFGVGVMLVLLGVKAIYKALGLSRIHMHLHGHQGHGRGHVHIHLHRPGEEHVHHHRHLLGVGAQPFCIGLIHGLAGSAALMILILGTIPSAIAALLYVAMFGLGSVGGMLVMSSLISLPFVLSAKRFHTLGKGLQLVVGLLSAFFGFFLVWQRVFQEHLLGP